MNASTWRGIALLLLVAATTPVMAQPGRHIPAPRPPADVPGRPKPKYIEQPPPPPPESGIDKRWGVLVIAGVFGVVIAFVMIADRRRSQLASQATPPQVVAPPPPAPAVDAPAGEIPVPGSTGITLDEPKPFRGGS